VSGFHQIGWDKSASLFEAYLKEQEAGERLVWVAHVQDEFAGYVTLKWQSEYPSFKAQNIPEIMDLNVLPSFRKMGVGSLLLDCAEKEALTKSQIIELAGPPSIIQYDENSKENDKKWIYVGRKYIKRAFFDPKIVNQEIVVIDFINPTLENSKYTAEKFIDEQKEFGVDRKVTKDYVKQKSYFKQFFGNLGKFNKKAKDKKIR
jgi:GNAT superfamily N-acetyltransferase